MCGIVGYARAEDHSAPLEDMECLERMTQTLSHRGPDDVGYHKDVRVAMGHRRLSVIDIAGGAQPMVLPDRELAIVFNGEIYNYLELNKELAELGLSARTRSDTETILLAYAAWGDGCIDRLNGMFSFVLYDAKERRLMGVRDRMGKKPFYYVHDGPFFAFASEAKALLQHPRVRRELDHEAAARYLMFEHVPAPYTIYKGMRKLRGGEKLVFDLKNGSVSVSQYWDCLPRSAGKAAGSQGFSEDQWAQRVREELRKAVERRLISDVPLGVFLSGGIDSSAVTAAMVDIQGRGNVKSFSIGFSDERFDETPHARRVAEHLGTDHHEEMLDPKASIEILPDVLTYLDEPFADASILPCYLLSRFTRQHVTVALGGDGGDELFAGYDTFKAIPMAQIYNAAVPGFLDKSLVRPLAGVLPVSTGDFSFDFKVKQFLRGAKTPERERLWRWLGAFVPEELRGLISPEFLEAIDVEQLYSEIHELHKCVEDRDPIDRDAYVFSKTYLPEQVLVKVDRATMACSLEARSPLLDREFVEFALSIPSHLKVARGRLKHVFKRALRGMLPDEILERPKKGFGIPVAAWFRNGLRELLLETLHERRIREGGLFSPDAVSDLITAHHDGRRDNRKPLWTLLMFESWRNSWLSPATQRSI